MKQYKYESIRYFNWLIGTFCLHSSKHLAFIKIDSLVIGRVKVDQEELELFLRLVKNLTVGARVEGRMCRAVLGLEFLLETSYVCGGIDPASGSSITHNVRVASYGQASRGTGSSGRHDCPRPRDLIY